MLILKSSPLIKRLVETRILKNINYQSLFCGDSPYVLKSESVRFFNVNSTLNNNKQCDSKDVYKISPLCPPRGYEYKQKPVSLKCPAKKPCPSIKKAEAKPKGSSAKPKKVCKTDSKEPPKKDPPKKEPCKDPKSNEEKRCAKKELKKCDKPEGMPTCGKPPDQCSVELPKSVKPLSKEKRPKLRPGMKIDCPPTTKKEIESKCNKGPQCCKKETDEEACCSTKPWPFNLLDKLCNKPPKKKCAVKPKGGNKKKMISISADNLLCPMNRTYSTSRLQRDNKSKEFHTSCKIEMRPECPPSSMPPCSKGLELSKETEKLMMKLRAVARSNRRRQPGICASQVQSDPCVIPTKGWGKTHEIVLMRDQGCSKKLPKKVFSTSRPVTRKLRKKP